MSDVVEKKGKFLSGPDRQPLDDMRDGKDIRQWPEPLGTVISHIHTTLFENYSGYDTESIEHQDRHKKYSFFAVLFGSTAIEVAIIQVFLTAQGIEKFNDYLKIIELISFCLALVAVSIAVLSHWHKKWLKKRFMAEQYRSLKFRAFLQPDLYCKSDKPWEERMAQWKGWLNAEKELIEKEKLIELQDCVENDTVSQPPPDISRCVFDETYLTDFIRYYHVKRLTTQIDYFEARATQLEGMDDLPRRVVSACFILSVFFLFGHFIIDFMINFPFFSKTQSFFHSVSLILLLCTLLIPIVALTFRTLRSSNEVARSASLFRSKRNALKEFEIRLHEETKKNEYSLSKILNIIWECENHLEKENREWLRIMNDAEWFI